MRILNDQTTYCKPTITYAGIPDFCDLRAPSAFAVILNLYCNPAIKGDSDNSFLLGWLYPRKSVAGVS
jgi:hypothetical protein